MSTSQILAKSCSLLESQLVHSVCKGEGHVAAVRAGVSSDSRVRSGHLIRAEGEEFNKNREQHSNTFTMTPPGANRDLEYRSEQHKENVAHE